MSCTITLYSLIHSLTLGIPYRNSKPVCRHPGRKKILPASDPEGSEAAPNHACVMDDAIRRDMMRYDLVWCDCDCDVTWCDVV